MTPTRTTGPLLLAGAAEVGRRVRTSFSKPLIFAPLVGRDCLQHEFSNMFRQSCGLLLKIALKVIYFGAGFLAGVQRPKI